MVVDKITWFVSFGDLKGEAPPKYVVVVVIESGGSGGKTSAPIAGQIYEAIKRVELLDQPIASTARIN